MRAAIPGMEPHPRATFECKTSALKVAGGKLKVPTGPGTGVEIDPGFIQKHRPVTA
ncbi:MAG TPA: hypothetical protein P5525_16470 [Candidatus Paceibacterota bacterium]|nr:hypothetical protein [Candidatus Paceibacterota bacterium]